MRRVRAKYNNYYRDLEESLLPRAITPQISIITVYVFGFMNAELPV